MKLIGPDECYSKMPKAYYGYNAYGNMLLPPSGYNIIPFLGELKHGDIPFDVYSGWLPEEFFNKKYHLQATSNGRWTTWARKK